MAEEAAAAPLAKAPSEKTAVSPRLDERLPGRLVRIPGTPFFAVRGVKWPKGFTASRSQMYD
jgi:hypothetical protein